MHKIAFLISSLNRGGTELRLLDVLRGLDRERFDPFLFVAKSGELLAEVTDQRVYVGAANGRNTLVSLPSLWRVLRRERPSVVWCVSHGIVGFAGRILAYALRTPVVIISLHGRQQGDKAALDWPNRLITPFTTDRIVVVSEKYREWLTAEGIPDRLITVQHNGVDVTRFSPTPNRMAIKQQVLGIDPARPVIVTVGNLRPIKAQDVLIRAARAVVDAHPSVLFVLVGEGSSRPTLEALREKLGLRDHIRLLGKRTDVPDILRACDIFTLTSNNEGCPNTVLEAMACGLPVVGTNVGGIPELIDATCSILVPPQDVAALAGALLQLLNAPEQRIQLGQHARQRVLEHFSRETMIQKREDLIISLLTQNS